MSGEKSQDSQVCICHQCEGLFHRPANKRGRKPKYCRRCRQERKQERLRQDPIRSAQETENRSLIRSIAGGDRGGW